MLENNRCSICIEEECRMYGRSPGSCSCPTCSKRLDCIKKLTANIRITNRCTQTCKHCYFSSCPGSTRVMNLETAIMTRDFLVSNGIQTITITGGEFWCNPEWYEILTLFLRSEDITLIRLITNGDWAEIPEVCGYIKDIISNSVYKNKLYIYISEDNWHNNKNGKRSDDFLKDIKCFHSKSSIGVNWDTLIPAGRAEKSINIFSTVKCYCLDRKAAKYNILIDERGNIFKCIFGAHRFAHISNYTSGGFNSCFKLFSRSFYSIPKVNCYKCFQLSNVRGISIELG